MVDKSKQGKRNRTAGHDFEREMAQKFRRWYPDARRGLQYQDGKHCPDIVGTDFWIECKHRKGMTPWQANACWIKMPGPKKKILIYRIRSSRHIRVVLNNDLWFSLAGGIIGSPDIVLRLREILPNSEIYDEAIEVDWSVFERAMDHWKGVQGEAGQSEKVPVA